MSEDRCAHCGRQTPFHLLDAKPHRLAGPSHTAAEIEDAMWENEDFDRLECKPCYGPGWAPGINERTDHADT